MASRTPRAGNGGGPNKTCQFKLVLLGESAVGKSSLVLRFVKGQFHEYQESTIGAAFLTQTICLDDTTVKFEIWDTAGQERYHSLAPMYYRGAQAAIVVYDITNQESFAKAKNWVKELQRQASPNIVIALSGNKADLAAKRVVEYEEAQAYAEDNGLLFMETSAKSSMNVNDIFLAIGSAFLMISNNGSGPQPRKRRLVTDSSQSTTGGGVVRSANLQGLHYDRVTPQASTSLLSPNLGNSENQHLVTGTSSSTILSNFPTGSSTSSNFNDVSANRFNSNVNGNDGSAETSFHGLNVSSSVSGTYSSTANTSGSIQSASTATSVAMLRDVFREIGSAQPRDMPPNLLQQSHQQGIVPSSFALTFAIVAAGRGTGNVYENRNNVSMSGSVVSNVGSNLRRSVTAANLRSRVYPSSDENSSSSFDFDAVNLMAMAPYGTLPQNIANRRLLAEMKQLEDLPLAGCQASPREENIFQWTAVIEGPVDTVYEGGTFFVDLIFNSHYPFVAPKVVFLTRIYHCNINSQGKVCMDPISSGWNSCMTISTVLQSLISLMYACNPKDALVPSIAEQFIKNPDEYEKMARIWTQRYAQ